MVLKAYALVQALMLLACTAASVMASARAASLNLAALQLDAGAGLTASIDPVSGGTNISIDGVPWLLSGSAAATFLGVPPRLLHIEPLVDATAPVVGFSMRWAAAASGAPLPWETSVRAGPVPGSLVFRQSWTEAYTRPPSPSPPDTPPVGAPTCGAFLEHTDQNGGRMCCGTPNATGHAPGVFAITAGRRAAALAWPLPNATATPWPMLCTPLTRLAGSSLGPRAREAGRSGGWAASSAAPVVAAVH